MYVLNYTQGQVNNFPYQLEHGRSFGTGDLLSECAGLRVTQKEVLVEYTVM